MKIIKLHRTFKNTPLILITSFTQKLYGSDEFLLTLHAGHISFWTSQLVYSLKVHVYVYFVSNQKVVTFYMLCLLFLYEFTACNAICILFSINRIIITTMSLSIFSFICLLLFLNFFLVIFFIRLLVKNPLLSTNTRSPTTNKYKLCTNIRFDKVTELLRIKY